jgi:hypothetical protein
LQLLDFDRAVALKLYEVERDEAREQAVALARMAAQMTATMMWCKHESMEPENDELERCRNCSAVFRSE